MIYREPPPDPVSTVCLIAEAPHIERAGQGISDFGKAEGWIGPDGLLRRGPVSPSGELPPTHFVCTLTLAKSVWQRLAAIIAQKKLPIDLQIVTDQDTHLIARGLTPIHIVTPRIA
jgi:hypothetical protein